MDQEKQGHYIKFPHAILWVVAILTAFTLAWSFYTSYQNKQATERVLNYILPLTELQKDIIYFDEVLTMSAMMATYSGQDSWQYRHSIHAEKLDDALALAKRLAPSASNRMNSQRVTIANNALIAMEDEAFALAQNDQLEEAQALLESQEYNNHKKAYSDAIMEFGQDVKTHVIRYAEEQNARSGLNIYIVTITLVIVGILWLLMFQVLLQWKNTISELIAKTEDARKKEEIARLELEKTTVSRDELLISQKRLEDEKQRADEANRAKSDFLANISHEIRTPMNGIIGTASLLSESKLGKKQSQYVKIIVDSGNLLLTLISDVLDISKIEAGEYSLYREHFILEDCIKSSISLHKSMAKEKGLKIILEYDTSLPSAVFSDQGRIQQVMNNLISNAIKFTDEGSVTISIEKKKHTFKISVIDTGIGIEQQEQAKLFNNFSQVSTQDHVKYGGTGLGLSISKALVELTGGTIGVESNPGHGSVFWFELPLINGDETEIQQNVLPSENASENKTFNAHILLAEDVATNRFIVTDMLEQMGLTFDIAEDGKVASDLARNNKYDLILMDLRMPVLDGMQASTIIREHQEKTGEHTPIIALTAHAMEEHKQQALNAGMDDFITKPIKKEVLIQIFNRFLETAK